MIKVCFFFEFYRVLIYSLSRSRRSCKMRFMEHSKKRSRWSKFVPPLCFFFLNNLFSHFPIGVHRLIIFVPIIRVTECTHDKCNWIKQISSLWFSSLSIISFQRTGSQSFLSFNRQNIIVLCESESISVSSFFFIFISSSSLCSS